MTDTSPILAMPYIQPSQAQKHVTHNEALSLLDVIVQLAVETASLATPPATAVEGDRYIVAANGQAAWAGQDHQIATFVSGAWMFTAPKAGWVAQVVDNGTEVVFDGTVWASRSLSNLPGLGIGASYDGYNRLVVSSDAVLLNNAGAGHQLKINKASAGDTASLLFQTGYGGRAEMGTAGTDDFSLKVSADGSSWTEALRVDAATGRVTVGVSGWREMLTAPRSYFVDQVLGDDVADGLSAGTGAFATLARAVAAVQGIDTGGHDITIQLADGTYTSSVAMAFEAALVGGGCLILQGNSGDPDQVTVEALGEVLIVRAGGVCVRGIRVQNASPTAAAVTVSARGSLTLDQVSFGPAGGHIDINGGVLRIDGGYAVKDGATYHLRLTDGGRFDGNGQTVTLESAPDFSDAFVVCDTVSLARMAGQSFAGTATGKRYAVSANAVIQSGGVVLPGDVAGTVQTGGQYI